jgi:proline iminopeptidase
MRREALLALFALILLDARAVADEEVRGGESGVLHVDGYDLRYMVEGDGRHALVIGSALYYPRVFSQELRDRLRMTFLDARPFAPALSGAQPVPAECHQFASRIGGDTPPEAVFALARACTANVVGITRERFTEDVEAARAQLGLDRFVLVGHSMFAGMAVAYALEHPEHVSHLVLVGAAPAPRANPQSYWNEFASQARKDALARAQEQLAEERRRAPLPDDLEFNRFSFSQAPMREYNYNVDQRWLWEGVRSNLPLVLRYQETVLGIFEQGLPELRTPVLAVLGKHDYPNPPSAWESLRSLPHLTVRVFDESGHAPMLEEPAEFDEMLMTWLAQNSAAD